MLSILKDLVTCWKTSAPYKHPGLSIILGPSQQTIQPSFVSDIDFTCKRPSEDYYKLTDAESQRYCGYDFKISLFNDVL